MEKKVIKEYWICFREAHYFIKHLLKEGFGHVYIIYKDKFNWMQIDPRNRALEVFILPYEVDQNVPYLIKTKLGHKIVKVKVELKHKKWPNLNIFSTIHCTNIVKYILGQRLWAFTPYRLYKRMERMVKNNSLKKGILEIQFL